jgi:hypothetical protein
MTQEVRFHDEFYNGSSAYKDERPFLQSLLEKEHEHSFYLIPDSFFKISNGKILLFYYLLEFSTSESWREQCSNSLPFFILTHRDSLLMNPSGPKS